MNSHGARIGKPARITSPLSGFIGETNEQKKYTSHSFPLPQFFILKGKFMQHSFDIDDAVKYGIEKAIILNNLRFWLEKNKANNQNVFDGYVWTYNSSEAYGLLFPYIKPKTIARYLREMEDEGIIISCQKSTNKLDRTKSYTLPEYSESSLLKKEHAMVRKCAMEGSKMRNVTDINNTDIKQDINKDQKTYCRDLKIATPKKSKFNFSDDDMTAATWMRDRVLLINPSAKQPNLESWANDVRMLREIDGRSLKEIGELFDWANRNDFWCSNILSPKTLRKQWDKLTLQRSRPVGNAMVRGGEQNLTADCTEAFRMIEDGEIL